MEHRCRPLSATLELAVAAGRGAGVTRVSDVTAFGVPGIPVFQATRPQSRSLAVSQGKGLSATSAIIGALLESTELWLAEMLEEPGARAPLSALPAGVVAAWTAKDDPLQVDLSLDLPRAWVAGAELGSGRACPVPWDLVSLNFTRQTLEFGATSNGLASGNSRAEALVSGVAEVLEHHFVAVFHAMSPRQRFTCQLNLDSIDDGVLRRLIRLVARAGYEIRAWSLANDHGLAVFEVALIETGTSLEDVNPPAGNGCHPDARIAFARALLEAVQSRAAMVAGARDDLTPDIYQFLPERLVGILLATFAIGEGPLDWNSVPSARLESSEHCLDFLLARAAELAPFPLVAFDHRPPAAGIHVVHVLAPGLLDEDRGPRRQVPKPAKAGKGGAMVLRPSSRKIIFGGPSLAGLEIPADIEVRPPARCGDLASLLSDPPAAVGLVDGIFRQAPTVWHKEILSLLAQGVRVLGGGSLGAIRAAELDSLGMEGVGEIYRAYRYGAVIRDDAVMIVHAPPELGYSPLSLAQVDAEWILMQLRIPPPARRMMQRIVRTMPYEFRTWPACLNQYRERAGHDFPVSLAELQAMPSLKQADSACLVAAMRECRPSGTGVATPPPITCHYRTMLARSAPAFAASLP